MRRLPLIHRITAWTALLGYALVASGLPLPLGGAVAVTADPLAAGRLAAKDRSRPFPCMDKPCGCATAEQCFATCCCNTPAELLAWAQAKGVDPAVTAALASRAAAPGEVVSACCTATRTTPATNCCSAAAPPACGARKASPRPADENPTRACGRAVVLRAALACGGIAAGWLTAGVALPPPVTTFALAVEPIGSTALIDESAFAARAAPALPPPRTA